MTYKSIIAHVEPNDEGRDLARAASALGDRLGARVIGVGARAYAPMPDPGGISALHLREAIDADLAEAERIFRSEMAPNVKSEWRKQVAPPTEAILRAAAAGDLIMAGAGIEPHPRETNASAADLIMAAGLPVLVVPGGIPAEFRTVLIAWKDTREARRAVWDALPLLKQAERVVVLRLARGGGETAADLSDVVNRLRAHGVAVEGEVRMRKSGSVAQQISDAARELGAELIVLGGYGHSRMQEWALGGVTQHMLQRASICAFFSH